MKLLIIFLLFAGQKSCYGKTEINKCCDNNYYVLGNHSNKMCEKLDSNTKLSLSNYTVYSKDLHKIGSIGDYFELKAGFFSDDFRKINSITSFTFYEEEYLIENGSVFLFLNNTDAYDIRNSTDFCIDHYIVDKTYLADLSEYIIVFIKDPEPERKPIYIEYGYLVSSVFLLLLLVVYCLLPELRRGLGGKILMSYAGSFMIVYLCLFILVHTHVKSFTIVGCLAITYVIYFFFLSSFCWTNVMSYDIYWTFRDFKQPRSIHGRGNGFKFAMYSLYAWSIPLAMTIILAVLNDIPQDRLPGIIKPTIGVSDCFITGDARRMYMHVPVLIMILANWVFFVMTVINFRRLNREFRVLSMDHTLAKKKTVKTQKNRFFVNLKLTVVMGLSWLLEVISSFSPDLTLWNVSDTYNVFMGLIIFAIFICKKKVILQLKKRLTCYERSNLTSSTSTKMSSRTGGTEEKKSSLLPINSFNAKE